MKSWTMWKKVIKCTVPSAVEMMLLSIVATLDTVMVGSLGKEALSVVGLSAQLRMLLLCLFFSLNTGVTATIARFTDKGENVDAACVVTNMTAFAGMSGIALAIGTCFFLGPLMRLTAGRNGDAAVVRAAVVYFRITVCSLPFQGMTMCICAAHRGSGKAKTALLINLAGALTHAILSYLLIYGKAGLPALGVYGAGWSMNTGVLVGFIASVITAMAPRNTVRFQWKKILRVNREDVLQIAKVSGNAAIEQLGMRIGYFICGRMIFGAGVALYAANQVCQQIASVTFSAGDGVGAAGTALLSSSQNEKRMRQAWTYSGMCIMIALGFSMILFASIWILRAQIAALFIGQNTMDAENVRMYAAQGLGALAFMQVFQLPAVATAGCLRGKGDNVYVAAVATFCVGVIRPVLTYLAVKVWKMNLTGIWILSMMEMVVRLCFFLPRFFVKGSKKLHEIS